MSENLPNLTALSQMIGDDKSFVLRIVQPGLAGLMDGSVSTLAPIFATAFATHNSRTVFLIGAASAVGAGISMAFSEGLSDDGELTGRGNPVFQRLNGDRNTRGRFDVAVVERNIPDRLDVDGRPRGSDVDCGTQQRGVERAFPQAA